MEYMTIKIPVATGEKLREIAKYNCRSMAAQIAFFIKQYFGNTESFEEYFEKNNLQETLDEALKGENCIDFDSWDKAKQFLNGMNQ